MLFTYANENKIIYYCLCRIILLQKKKRIITRKLKNNKNLLISL